MNNLQISLILERMKNAANIRTDKALSDLLGVSPNALANWKTRNSMPLENVFHFCETQNVNADWLLFGKESINLDTATNMALMAFNSLDDRKKLEALSFMSGLNNNSTPTGQGNVTQSAKGNVTNMVAGNMHK